MERALPIDYEPVFDDAPTAIPVEDRTTRFRPEPPPPPPAEDRATRDRPEPEQSGYVLPNVTAADLPQISTEGDKAPAKPVPIDYEPVFDEPAKPASEKPGFISNIARGIGERGVQLIAGTAGTTADIAEGAADWLDQNLGKPTWDADGNFSWRQMTPEETAGTSSWITQKLKEVQKGMSDPDFGYDPRTTWQDVKNAPFTNVIPFAIEQGLVSLPDMVAAVKNAPLYVIEQAGEIGAGRAKSEGRTEPTFGDIVKALPAAVISQMMEKIGTEKLFGVGEAALTELKQLPAELLKTLATEGATEAAQQAAQYGGEHAFTKQGIDWWQAAEETLQAGLVGALFGPAVRVATAGAEIATAPSAAETPPKADDQPGVAAPVLPEGTPAETMPAAGVPTPGSLAATTPPQPAGTGKQPEDATVPAAKEPVAPTGPVTVVEQGTPAPDVAAAAAGVPIEQPVHAIPEPGEEAPEGFNIRETLPEEATPEEVSTATSEHEARIRSMFTDVLETEKRQAALGDRTTVAPAGDAEAAAIAAIAPKRTQETLGTGQALGAVPVQPIAAGPATLATPQVVAAPAAPTAAVETPAARPIPNQLAADVSGEPVSTPEPAAPEPVTAENVPATIAAFTPEPAPVALAPPAAAAPLVAEPVAEPVVAPAPVLPGAKGELLKRRVREKALPEPAQAPTELIRREAISAQPAPQPAPAPAAAVEEGPTKAPRTNLSRDAANHARDAPAMRRSTVTELPDFHSTIDDVSAEVVARLRHENPGASPAQIIRDAEPEIVAETTKRLEAAAETAEEARVALEEAATKEGQRKTAKEARAAAMAEAATGQKKERRKKGGEKSGVGIRGESEKATLGAITEELKKPEAEREPLLMAWQAVHVKQKILPKNPKPEAKADVEAKRTLYKEQKQQLQELRAQKAEAASEAAAAEPKGLNERATKVQGQVKTVLEAHPLPPGNAGEKALTDHFKAFREALRAAGRAGLTLADHIDRTHQSMEENLAIFARKVRAKRPSATDPQDTKYPHDFALAQLFMEKGADQDFYGLTTNETLSGSSYNEALGEDTEASTANQEHEAEDTSHVAGTHRSYEATASPDEAEEQMLIRSGRAETRARAASRVARDEAAYKERRPFEVTRPETGKKVTVTGETRKASDVLREIHRLLQRSEPRGFVSILQNALVRHLSQMVGNVDVHFISAADMMQLHDRRGVRPAGLYYNYSAEERVAGARPQVFIDEEIAFHSDEYTHTVLHELTHAATSLALRENIRGTADIVGNMMRALRTQMSAAQLKQFDYAFNNPAEFIAEAFSNVGFQEALAAIPMPDRLARQISGVSANRQPSLWDGVVAMISSAVGMLRGQRGQSYMEQVAKLFPEISHSEQGQRVLAREQAAKGPERFQKAVPTHPLADMDALALDFNQILDGVKSRGENAITPKARSLANLLTSTAGLIRKSQKLFGGPNNPYEARGNVQLERETLRNDLRKNPVPDNKQIDSQQLEEDLLRLKYKDKAVYGELNEVAHEGSRYGIDPSKPLNHPNNGHVNKTGPLHQQIRAMHAELHKRWNAMTKPAQAVGNAVYTHLRAVQQDEGDEIIRHAIETAQSAYGAKKLPGSMKDAIAWIRSNPEKRRADGSLTQVDKDWYDALGKTASSLAGVPMLRKTKGAYVPFMRRGRFFFSAVERPFGTMAEQKNVPRGAVLDAVTAQEKETPNRLLFKNRADFDAFADSYPGQVSSGIKWVDPKTGKATTKDASYADPKTGQLVTPEPLYVATVQNKRIEMSDNKSQLRKRAEELAADGHKVTSIGLSKHGLKQRQRELATPGVNRLVKSLEQTTAGHSTVSQQAVANAIYEAHARLLTAPSHVQRSLKRRNVLGENQDLFQGIRDYNSQYASHAANLKMASKLSQTDIDLEKYIRDQQHIEPIASTLTIQRQAMREELNNRITGYQGDKEYTGGARAMEGIRVLAYLKHLATPVFSVMQLMQPMTTTLPVLYARYGLGASMREMGRAYRIGAGGALLSGLKETIGAAGDIRPGIARRSVDNDAWWRRQVAGEADAGPLQRLFDRIRQLGFGASSGMESSAVAEQDMNPVEKALNRVVAFFKALPEAIEGINRYTTAIAAYRLGIRKGLSEDEAIRQAVLTVEETQGGYGAANNPVFFQNPVLKPATQFRKYSIAYGGLFYRNLAQVVLPGSTRQERVQAAKTVAGLAFATTVLAGTFGLPLVEPLRLLINTLNFFGLSDDDWDDKEVAMQKWVANMTAWATGSKSLGDALAEANTRGWTRLIGIDTANNFGNDNLFLFGQAKDVSNPESIKAWLFDALTGASGGVVLDSLKALAQGDVAGALPLPKIVSNMIKAYGLKTEGTVSKTTGEQYAKPVSTAEAAAQAFGFTPASSARQWEGGGGARQAKKTREMHGDRNTLMAQWRNASGSERASIWRDDIRAWNASHRNPDEKIQMQDLMSSKRSKKADERRRKKAAQYED